MYNTETKLYDGYIYCIKNITDGMMYIGQTSVSILARWRSHISSSKSSKECHLHLHRAIRKYGVSSFEIKEIESISAPSPEKLKKCLNEREQYYILALKTLSPFGYNMKDGGDATVASVKRGVYKVSKDGEVLSHYPSIRDAGIENNFLPTLINKACMSKNHFSHGFFWFYDSEYEDSPSYIKIPQQTRCGNKKGDKIGGKCVYQFTKDGDYICSFPSARDAATSVGVTEDKVAVCCRKNGKLGNLKYTSGGYKWVYSANFYIQN